jgi:hypothetical protein
MNRCSLWIAGLALLTPCVAAQSKKLPMLRPVTGPVRDAGIYHMQLGTWTRRVATPGVISQDVVYANTCPTGYNAMLLTNEYLGDEGRLPGPNGPILCDTGILSTNAGCHCHYDISAFEIAYCTGELSNVSFRIGFQSAYIACAMPATNASFTLTGLPGAQHTASGCWLVTIDLGANGFQLSADGGNCSWAPGDQANIHLFGWTFENLNSSASGPLVAGNGGFGGGSCSMVDGTRWDTLTCSGQGGGRDKWPNNVGEPGFGMDTQDRFRDDSTTGGPVGPPGGPGCYFFGGNPVGSFHLRLFADSSCTTCNGCSATDVCVPGVGGVLACPCGNAQVPAGSSRGCNNSANTGGAVLTSSGLASLTGDSLHFGSAFAISDALSILMQGQLPLGTGAQFGQGVSCMSAVLLRMYVHTAVAGVTAFPQGVEQSVHVQSSVRGDVITSGSTRLYAAYYRDPTVLGSCAATATYNVTQSQSLTWGP